MTRIAKNGIQPRKTRRIILQGNKEAKNYENFTISSKNNDGIFDVQKIIYNLL